MGRPRVILGSHFIGAPAVKPDRLLLRRFRAGVFGKITHLGIPAGGRQDALFGGVGRGGLRGAQGALLSARLLGHGHSCGAIARRDVLGGIAGSALRALREVRCRVILCRLRQFVGHQEHPQALGTDVVIRRCAEGEAENEDGVRERGKKEGNEQAVANRSDPFPYWQSPRCHG